MPACPICRTPAGDGGPPTDPAASTSGVTDRAITLTTFASRWRSPSTSSSACRRTTDAEPLPRVRPERDVDHPGLVLERQEHRPARGHRVLARDDEPADADRARPLLGERRVGHRPQPVQRLAEQRHRLAPRVEAHHRVGVAQPLRLGDRGQRRRLGRRQPQVHRPAGGPASSPARRAPSARPRAPSTPPRPRAAATAAPAAAGPASPAPRPGSAARRPPRPARSARPRPRGDVYGPRASSASSRASCSSPIPLTRCSPSRTPQPVIDSAAHRSRAAAPRDHARGRADRRRPRVDARSPRAAARPGRRRATRRRPSAPPAPSPAAPPTRSSSARRSG